MTGINEKNTTGVCIAQNENLNAKQFLRILDGLSVK
jgi:hypothetical protein